MKIIATTGDETLLVEMTKAEVAISAGLGLDAESLDVSVFNIGREYDLAKRHYQYMQLSELPESVNKLKSVIENAHELVSSPGFNKLKEVITPKVLTTKKKQFVPLS